MEERGRGRERPTDQLAETEEAETETEKPRQRPQQKHGRARETESDATDREWYEGGDSAVGSVPRCSHDFSQFSYSNATFGSSMTLERETQNMNVGALSNAMCHNVVPQ